MAKRNYKSQEPTADFSYFQDVEMTPGEMSTEVFRELKTKESIKNRYQKIKNERNRPNKKRM